MCWNAFSGKNPVERIGTDFPVAKVKVIRASGVLLEREHDWTHMDTHEHIWTCMNTLEHNWHSWTHEHTQTHIWTHLNTGEHTWTHLLQATWTNYPWHLLGVVGKSGLINTKSSAREEDMPTNVRHIPDESVGNILYIVYTKDWEA